MFILRYLLIYQSQINMKNTLKLLTFALMGVTFVAVSCQKAQNNTTEGPNNEKSQTTTTQNKDSNKNVKKAFAVINSNNQDVKAWVRFTKADKGVKIHGEFSGFTEGKHAVHIHVYGDCRADDYSSAGPHLEFKPMPEDAAITGNVGEFSSGQNGTAIIDTVIADANLKNLVGRAIMVHQKGNNLNPPPTGNAGPRIACGVIGLANPDYSAK